MSKKYKRLRSAVSLPALDREAVFALVHGHTVLAGEPIGLVDDANNAIPDVARLLVKRHGLPAIRREAKKLGLVEAGQALWCETIG